MLYKAKAPGSLILLGEYAVLSGKPAIVCAIDQFIEVTIQPRQDQLIKIQSTLGQYTTDIFSIKIQAPFKYVLATLPKQLPSGCDIIIRGNCESSIGLGSSAAVTVATQVAVHLWLKKSFTPEDLWHQTLSIIHRVQGKGSGADLAASIYGGVISFQNNPLRVEHLASLLPICCVYSGNKLTTSQAIHLNQERRQQQPALFAAMDEAMTQLTLAAIPIIKNQDWPALGLLLDQAQEIMISLGVSNELLNTMIEKLRNQPEIWGAKISGSGMGDCIIGLGHLQKNVFPMDSLQQQLGVRQIPVAIAASGVEFE